MKQRSQQQQQQGANRDRSTEQQSTDQGDVMNRTDAARGMSDSDGTAKDEDVPM